MIVRKIGFTGTQLGMTGPQLQTFAALLTVLSLGHRDGSLELHHGDCEGADEEAHEVAIQLGVAVVIHPPDDPRKQALCEGARQVRTPKPYLVRNEVIAAETSVLIAAPRQDEEVRRSGTWATVRRARGFRRMVILVLPDGTLKI